jgi:hypothetical protein
MLDAMIAAGAWLGGCHLVRIERAIPYSSLSIITRGIALSYRLFRPFNMTDNGSMLFRISW